MTIWSITHGGHKIRVICKISSFSVSFPVLLEIDGKIVKHTKRSVFKLPSNLIYRFDFDGTEKDIEVRLSQKIKRLKLGCQIFVDDRQIGGDKRIKYLTLEQMTQIINKGFFHYFIRNGILTYGITVASLIALTPAPPVLINSFITFFFNMFFIGFAMSYYEWFKLKKRIVEYKKTSL